MMQMLQGGGLDVLTDNLRSNDDSNPKGYMEFEKVKKLAQDNSWVNQAEGKVVKVIAQLLQYLPNNYNYKIIFMQREMSEVLKSQQKMLGKDTSIFPMAFADTFQKQLERSKTIISAMPNMEAIYINYKDIIENPLEQAENVNSFLSSDLSLENMVKAVDKTLYRNKI